MPASAEHFALPFDDAIEFFRGKVNLPTRTWKDLWEGMHARAFVSAGAMKHELLSDLRGATDKALSKGTTLADFRKDFDNIVSRHGWVHRGKPGWRAALIYDTNLSTAYHAGHWKGMTDPDVLKARPFLRYVPSSSAEKRPEHVAWYNIVLPADHPWWKTHYPPNGWGCKCGAVNHSAREVERLKAEEADGPHPIKTEAPPDEYYDWTDKTTGEVIQVPKGIDPGWAYNVGESAWGRQLSEVEMDAWRAMKKDAWETLTPGNWQTEGRPRNIDRDIPKAAPNYKAVKTGEAVREQLVEILGGEEKVFSFTVGTYRHDVLVNAETLAEHIDPNRAPYLPLLPETLEEPYEVWLRFDRHKGTGRVVLRQRIIKGVDLKKYEGLLVVTEAVDGVMTAWSYVPARQTKYINAQRAGKLIWAR
jgi:hypothetical protein